MKLINPYALKAALNLKTPKRNTLPRDFVMQAIDEAPAVEAIPVFPDAAAHTESAYHAYPKSTTNYTDDRNRAFADFVVTGRWTAVKALCRQYGMPMDIGDVPAARRVYRYVEACQGISPAIRAMAREKLRQLPEEGEHGVSLDKR